jgi:hypothetical protein
LYFACSSDFKLAIFNEHFNLIFQNPLPVGLLTSLYFDDKANQLICAGKEGMFQIDLDINFKYEPRMAILLDPKGQSISIKLKTVKQQPQDNYSKNLPVPFISAFNYSIH